MSDITPQFIKAYLESAEQEGWDIMHTTHGILASALMDAEPEYPVSVGMTRYAVDGRKMADIPEWYQDYLEDLLHRSKKPNPVDKQTAIAMLQKYL